MENVNQQPAVSSPNSAEQSAPPAITPKLFAGRYQTAEVLEQAHIKTTNELKQLQDKFKNFQASIQNTNANEAPNQQQPVQQQQQQQNTQEQKQTFASMMDAAIFDYQSNNGKLSNEIKEKFGITDRYASELESGFGQKVDQGLKTLQEKLTQNNINMKVNDVIKESSKYFNEKQIAALQTALDNGFTGAFVDMARTVAEKASQEPQKGNVANNNYGASPGFSTPQQMLGALNDPRMGADSSYTKMILQKMEMTPQSIQKSFLSGGRE